MATDRDKPRTSAGLRFDDSTNRSRTGLAEAMTELRRLTQDPRFEELERVLADLRDVPGRSDVNAETVRRLRQWSAEHLRVAAELEAAARCCRLVEREVSKRVDALLAGGKGKGGTTHGPDVGALPASARRGNGPGGWLRRSVQRRRDDPQLSGDGPELDPSELGPLTPVFSSALFGPSPAPVVPVVDIAALALGPLEVRVAGRRVPRWNSLKARAVFQYLLIHQDRPTRRDVLMDLQWPDHSHNSARNNLNVALYSLRNTLDGLGPGVEPILYRDGCYVLNSELTWWIDRNEFLSALHDAQLTRLTQQATDAYRRAVQLYRGPLFEDDGAGEWYLPEQDRLKELYLQALEYLAGIYLELGDLPYAVHCGQLAADTDPCCEPIHRMLMRCYAAQHQQQLVSRQYRSCVAALHDELGVPPADETVQLFRKLTSGSSP
jgi:DNA-binding SARP family transcriptional activator